MKTLETMNVAEMRRVPHESREIASLKRVVLDTNVLVAAIRSQRGASFELMHRIGDGTFEIVISVALALEYESVMLRHAPESHLTDSDVINVIDYVCDVGNRQEIFFLWRPYLRDPNDDLVLELAVAAGCDAIVTHNIRDFDGISRFGIDVLTPAAFLLRL
jgi:putative PIN family toxin of toxin-antitoxin system